MATVKNIVESKGTQVWTISPDLLVKDALQMMAERGIGALIVMQSGKIAGIFSERDYARRVAQEQCICLDVPVREMMSHPVYFIQPDQSAEDCMGLMTAKHIRHVPVVQDEKLIGLISIGDVVKWLIAEKESSIQTLEHYITGSQTQA
jgi:CBS domain-containing protein